MIPARGKYRLSLPTRRDSPSIKMWSNLPLTEPPSTVFTVRSYCTLHLLDLGGDISGNGLSKLFLTIAAAFAEAERDRIRERIGQVKADQKARGRYLGGKVPFGYRRGGEGELVPHEAEQEAIREMIALRAEGNALRAIAAVVQAKGHKISHEGVAGALRVAGIA